MTSQTERETYKMMICVFMFRFKGKPEAIGLTLMALPIYLILNFSHSEWNPRVQLSAHVLLIPVASLGWIMFQTWLMKNFDQSGNVSAETKS